MSTPNVSRLRAKGEASSLNETDIMWVQQGQGSGADKFAPLSKIVNFIKTKISSLTWTVSSFITTVNYEGFSIVNQSTNEGMLLNKDGLILDNDSHSIFIGLENGVPKIVFDGVRGITVDVIDNEQVLKIASDNVTVENLIAERIVVNGDGENPGEIVITNGGKLVGDVQGNVTGNVTGDVHGNVYAGTVAPNIAGATINHTGSERFQDKVTFDRTPKVKGLQFTKFIQLSEESDAGKLFGNETSGSEHGDTFLVINNSSTAALPLTISTNPLRVMSIKAMCGVAVTKIVAGGNRVIWVPLSASFEDWEG